MEKPIETILTFLIFLPVYKEKLETKKTFLQVWASPDPNLQSRYTETYRYIYNYFKLLMSFIQISFVMGTNLKIEVKHKPGHKELIIIIKEKKLNLKCKSVQMQSFENQSLLNGAVSTLSERYIVKIGYKIYIN